MAQLAIKGHETRGKEVIKVLEMLGGKTRYGKFEGNELSCGYYIKENGYIGFKHYSLFDDTTIFTLEEFLEKFPYKIGDKVIYDKEVFNVVEMMWNKNLNTISYGLYNDKRKELLTIQELQPYKEETMEKINVAKLLKDCPTGMELDCTMFEKVTFVRVQMDRQFPIEIAVNGIRSKYLTKEGCFHDNTLLPEAKCVIFPKGKTTWEGFQIPFKDGDILATNLGSVFFLNTHLNTDEYYGCYVGIGGDGSFHICEPFAYKECCGFATEKEKEKLFKAIKDKGYKWNARTKTLEKLIEPKFKVGDRIKTVYNPCQCVIKEITDTHYTLIEVEYKYQYTEPINEDENWELVPDKFDISTLKPFDKVLCRQDEYSPWMHSFFGIYSAEATKNPFICSNGFAYKYCIPYEGNEHLLDKTDDCDEYFKTWR